MLKVFLLVFKTIKNAINHRYSETDTINSPMFLLQQSPVPIKVLLYHLIIRADFINSCIYTHTCIQCDRNHRRDINKIRKRKGKQSIFLSFHITKFLSTSSCKTVNLLQYQMTYKSFNPHIKVSPSVKGAKVVQACYVMKD